MNKLILTRGIPASGKTTFAKSWVAQAEHHRVRVNRDDMRFNLFGRYWDVDEKAVTIAQQAAVLALLEAGKSVIVDDTNLDKRNVEKWLHIARKADAIVEFRDFPVDLTEAINRDALRERQVGKDVILKFYNKVRNGFPPVPELGPEWYFDPFEERPDLPGAILVDIDGTLAHMTNRGPYDTTRYKDDALDKNIADLVRVLHNSGGAHIIIMSGRSEDFKDELVWWLNHHQIPREAIFMRPSGDQRNDAIVKNELYEKHVKGWWDVRFVLDDRDRVIQMWREKGIKALQVEYGNF